MTAYEEYVKLHKALGYSSPGFAHPVWNGCTPEAQENMLGQLRAALGEKDRYVERHGEVW
jgi:hypothetical protein